jgi:hypothetical protein
MCYGTGEDPLIGDIVGDKSHRTGAVRYFIQYDTGVEELVILYDDGTTGIRHYPDDIILIARKSPDEIPTAHHAAHIKTTDKAFR